MLERADNKVGINRHLIIYLMFLSIFQLDDSLPRGFSHFSDTSTFSYPHILLNK